MFSLCLFFYESFDLIAQLSRGLQNHYHLRTVKLKYTEVQSQQMDFPQSPSGGNNNPKISTYNLIFVVIIIFIVLRFVVLSSFLFA